MNYTTAIILPVEFLSVTPISFGLQTLFETQKAEKKTNFLLFETQRAGRITYRRLLIPRF